MAENKTHWKVLVDVNYLGAYSFNDKVNEITVTIKKLDSQMVFNPRENKEEACRVMYFEEENVNGIDIKPFIINKTNCERIEQLYGTPYIEDWVGKRITLMKSSVKVAGELTDCIRVKLEVPPFKAQAKTKQAEQHFCSVCGTLITSEKIYKASIEKFGVAVCSKACAESIENNAKVAENEKNVENAEENN